MLPGAHLRAFWTFVIGADPADGWSAPDLVESLQRVFGVTELLDEWSADDSLGAALQLAAFVDDLRYGLPDAELWGVEGARAVERWLRDPARKATLEAAFERYLDGPAADRLARAIDVYGWSLESDLGHERPR